MFISSVTNDKMQHKKVSGCYKIFIGAINTSIITQYGPFDQITRYDKKYRLIL